MLVGVGVGVSVGIGVWVGVGVGGAGVGVGVGGTAVDVGETGVAVGAIGVGVAFAGLGVAVDSMGAGVGAQDTSSRMLNSSTNLFIFIPPPYLFRQPRRPSVGVPHCPLAYKPSEPSKQPLLAEYLLHFLPHRSPSLPVHLWPNHAEHLARVTALANLQSLYDFVECELSYPEEVLLRQVQPPFWFALLAFIVMAYKKSIWLKPRC